MFCKKTWTVIRIVFSLSILISLWLYCEAGSSPLGTAATNGLEMRVMSFNIRYGTAGDGENDCPPDSDRGLDLSQCIPGPNGPCRPCAAEQRCQRKCLRQPPWRTVRVRILVNISTVNTRG